METRPPGHALSRTIFLLPASGRLLGPTHLLAALASLAAPPHHPLAAHAVQFTCPTSDVYSPASHSVHVLIDESFEYLPTVHSVHELPPVAGP